MSSDLNLKFEQGGLTILVSRAKGSASVTWLGVSDSRNPGAFLNPIVQRLVDELKECTVTVDFTRMEFMNSSTVAPIINLIKRLNANRIDAVVLFKNDDWQRTHLRCMQTITRVLKHVRVEGRTASTQ
jgi:hypothetical protein